MSRRTYRFEIDLEVTSAESLIAAAIAAARKQAEEEGYQLSPEWIPSMAGAASDEAQESGLIEVALVTLLDPSSVPGCDVSGSSAYLLD